MDIYFGDFQASLEKSGTYRPYEHSNFQDLAMQNFKGVDILDYTARMIACIVSILNPQKIILVESPHLPKNLQAIIEKCAVYIPKSVIPKLEMSNHFHEFYQEGLLDLGRQLLFDG